MKHILAFIVSIIVFIGFSTANAQFVKVNEYYTIVKTTKGTVAGVLEDVNDQSVHILNEKGEAVIPFQMIKKIILKSFKRSLLRSNYIKTPNEVLTPSEMIHDDNSAKVVHVGAAAGILANVIAATTRDETTYQAAQAASIILPIAALVLKNSYSNLNKFKIYGNPDRYLQIKPELQSYAVQYQMNPNKNN